MSAAGSASRGRRASSRLTVSSEPDASTLSAAPVARAGAHPGGAWGGMDGAEAMVAVYGTWRKYSNKNGNITSFGYVKACLLKP